MLNDIGIIHCKLGDLNAAVRLCIGHSLARPRYSRSTGRFCLFACCLLKVASFNDSLATSAAQAGASSFEVRVQVGGTPMAPSSIYPCCHLYISPSIPSSTYLSISPAIPSSTYLSVSPSIPSSTYLSISLIIVLSEYLPIYPSIYLSISPSIPSSAYLSIHLPFFLSEYLPICLSLHLSLHLPICLSNDRSI